MKTILKSFASGDMDTLCEEIENYAEMKSLEIKQISAFIDVDKILDQRAIVIFEEKGE